MFRFYGAPQIAFSRDGSGNYSLPQAAFTAGTTIESTKVNSNFSDIASALTASLAKDGQTTPTANLPMGSFKHTGVANATARTHYAAAGQIADNSMGYAADTGSADAYAIAPAPGITAYAVGQRFTFKVTNANLTTTPTLAVNGLTAGTIKWPDGSALAAGDLPANALVEVVVAATTPVYHLQSPNLVGVTASLKKASNLSDVTSVATSRVNLQIDSRTTAADTSPTAAATAVYIAYTSITAARTVTLPAASTVNAGHVLWIADESGSASSTNTISVAPNGTDTIDGSNTTQVAINIPRGSAAFMCDGSGKWTPLKWSVVYANSIGGNVSLTNTGTWFDGPSVAQGTVGRWMAMGNIVVVATDASQNMHGRLYDGSTVIDSCSTQTTGANAVSNMGLSGYVASPAGNIRIQANSPSTTNANIQANKSGAGNDSHITVWRVP